MESEWTTIRLGDLTKWSSGGTPSKAKPEFWNGDIPWISASSMKTPLLCDSCLKLTRAGLENGSRLADTNSILLLVRGSELHKRIPVGIATKPIAFNQDVKAIKVSSELRSDYLFYWLIGNEPLLLNKVEHTGIGAGKLDTKVLKNLPLRLPPLPEQRAIAHVLGVLDDKIELNRQMNATLEAMAHALFKSWFVDFDPVIDNALAAGNSIPDELQARASVRESLGDARNPLPENLQNLFPATFTQTEELGWIPEGWDTQPLYDIASFINGAAYRNFHFTDEAGALPVVKIAEIKGGVSSQTKFTKTALADKYRIGDGDILFSWSGNPDTSIDTFVWTGGPRWLNQHIFRVGLNTEEDRNFVYYQLKLLRPVFAEIARNKQTTGLGHVTAQDMKRLPVIHTPEGIFRDRSITREASQFDPGEPPNSLINKSRYIDKNEGPVGGADPF